MAKLTVKNLKIEFTEEVKGEPTSDEILEWLCFEIGISPQMSMHNKLSCVSIADCKVSYDSLLINEKEMTKGSNGSEELCHSCCENSRMPGYRRCIQCLDQASGHSGNGNF